MKCRSIADVAGDPEVKRSAHDHNAPSGPVERAPLDLVSIWRRPLILGRSIERV
jgi:hypothetical protein